VGREDSISLSSPSSFWSLLQRTGWLGLYVVGLAVAAAGLMALLIIYEVSWPASSDSGFFAWPGLLVFVAIGVFAEKYTVRVGRGMEVSAGFLAFFLAAAIVGPLGSLVVAVTSQVWLIRRSDWQRGVCFASALGLAAGCSALLYWALSGRFDASEVTVAGIGFLSGLLFQAVNYVVFIPVSWIRRGMKPAALWREGFQPFLPFHFFFLSISLGLIFIYRYYVNGAGPDTPGMLWKSTLLIIVCILPVLGLIYAFRAFAHQRELARHNAALARRNERLALQAVASQVTALDLKDNYTARHSAAVAQWSHDIAKALKLSAHDQNVTHLAGLLHDVGKIGVPDDVLNCPGKLDPVSWALVETHAQNGQKILSNIDQFDELANVVLYHHEHYGGGGYPHGAAGDAIPLISRIICVADSYSAMVSDRPYRKRLPVDVATGELEAKKGIQFDPAVVETFLGLLQHAPAAYREGEMADFRVEFQKVKFLRDLEPEPEEDEADGKAPDRREPAPSGAAA